MAAVNLASVTTMTAYLKTGDLTTTGATDLLTVASSDAYKIEAIFLCNNDTSNSCTATLELSADGSNFNFLAKGLVIPPATTISIIDRPIFLKETQIIRGSASANGDIDYVITGTLIE